MLDAILRRCLENRRIVLVVAAAVAAYGTWLARRLPIDVLPDLTRPAVTVLTEAPGLSPLDIEQRITLPIESALNGAVGVLAVRSRSGMGLSSVDVVFDWGSDPYRNRQVVQEKLQPVLGSLPDGARPVLAPLTSIMGQVQLLGLRSPGGSVAPAVLREVAERIVRRRLLAIPGVAQVSLVGGAPRELQVTVDAARMRAEGIDFATLADALRAASQNAGGGWLATGAASPLVRLEGLVRRADELAAAVVRDAPDGGRPLRVDDLGDVAYGPSTRRTGDAGIGSGPGVLVAVYKQPGIDTLELADRVGEAVDELVPGLPDDVEVQPALYRQAEFIRRAVDNVAEAVWLGAILVFAVLALFLWNLRTTLITLTAIPVSVAVTALVFHAAGLSINTMTLGGLAVAIGALVDDAIVDVENVFRRLRESAVTGRGPQALRVTFAACREVRRPILVGTLVVAAVYLPLFALGGMEGRLFTPIGVTYIVSLLASLAVALTVTPVLCYLLLPASLAVRTRRVPAAVRWLQDRAEGLIRAGVGRPVAVASAFAVAVVLALGMLASRGREFLPAFNEGTVQVGLYLPPSTGLEQSAELGARLQRVLMDIDGVATLARKTGRPEGDPHADLVSTNEVVVGFDADLRRPRAEVLEDLRTALAEHFPGVAVEVEQPLAHLLSHMLTGVTGQVAIKVRGDDLAALRRVAGAIEAGLGGIPGVVDARVVTQRLVDEVEVAPDRAALAASGLSVAVVAAAVRHGFGGGEVDRIIVDGLVYPVVLRLQAEQRTDLDTLRDLPVGGGWLLGELAGVRTTRSPNIVEREDVQRRIVVQHNVAGRAVGDVVTDVESLVGAMRPELPAGTSITVEGQHESERDARRTLIALSAVSLLAMIALIWGHYRSLNLTLQTLLNVPAAFIGAACFVTATGQTVSVATLVGLIALGGIATRNGILLIDQYLHLIRDEGMELSVETLVRAGRTRVVPVVMTAATTGIALLPLVLRPDEPGRELLYPVASVIVGGLLTSTLLDLLLTPAIFFLFGRSAAGRAR